MRKTLVAFVVSVIASNSALAGMTQDEKADRCAALVTPVTMADNEAGTGGRLKNTPTYRKLMGRKPVNSTLSQEAWVAVQDMHRAFFDAGQEYRDQNIRGDDLARALIGDCFNALAGR